MVCTTSSGAMKSKTGSVEMIRRANSLTIAFGRWVRKTGPVCAPIASMWRVRASSLSLPVRLCFGVVAVVVLTDGADRDRAGRGAPRHYQSIKIEQGLFLDDKRRLLDQPVEIGRGLGVDLIGVDVHAF